MLQKFHIITHLGVLKYICDDKIKCRI